LTQLPAEGRQGDVPEWPLGPDIETHAQLQVARDKVEDLQYQYDEGKPVGGRLTKAQERVAVLQHIVEIQAEAELQLWAKLWATPMAAAWERLRFVDEVALYVRHQVLAANGNMKAAVEARQRGDRLGLSNLALLRLRWEISADEVGERRAEAAAEPAAKAPRTRFKVVDASAG
jgi:hypothetical protein